MTAFLIIVGLLLALALLLRWFLKSSPRRIAGVVRRLSAWLLLGGGVLLALRGLGVIGVPMALLGLSLLRAGWWPSGDSMNGGSIPGDEFNVGGGAGRDHDPSGQNVFEGEMTPRRAREILGVGEDATEEEIRAAYRRLMKKAHPDAGGFEWMAREVNMARDVLLRELRARKR